VEGDFFAVDEGDLMGAELGLVPVWTGAFMVAEDGDAALCPEPGEEIGGVAFAIKN
jgi:hypothetical protein